MTPKPAPAPASASAPGTMFDHIIIGNSAAGIGGIEGIRSRDKNGSICVISDEPYHTYSRTLIGEYLSGHKDFKDLMFRPMDFYERKNVTVMLATKVTAIDAGKKAVTLTDGTALTYGNLLLATGGKPFVPPMKGGNKQGVLNFIAQGDAEQIASRLPAVKRVVVIGGGLIGVDVTWALVRKGIKVSVVELKGRCLNLILDKTASDIFEARMREEGVEIHVNTTVKEVKGRPGDDTKVAGVILSDDTFIPCDIVVVAIGVVPRGELAQAAGIKFDKGISIDDHMKTSAPDVYAAGDCVEMYDFAYEVIRTMPVWPNAFMGGRIAGINMAGGDATFPTTTAMNSMNYFDIDVVSGGVVNFVGNMDPKAFEVLSTVNAKDRRYRMLTLKGDRIVGMTFMGEISEAGIVYGLMKDGIDVSKVKGALLDPTFSFAHMAKDTRKVTQKGERPAGMGPPGPSSASAAGAGGARR